ncbi:MAG: acetoacetate--CoA ligase [Deltaproteobacteria bacterium]|nr:acetoacetate--CoA ligase [Deltaproteobacteria bacterium]
MSKEPLWKPSRKRAKSTNIYAFMQHINKKFGKDFKEYADLHQWSIENIADFWTEMWELAEIQTSKGYDQIVDDEKKMPGAKWFEGARLNFAENLLRYRDDKPAIVFRGEAMDKAVRFTYAELYDEVARLAKSLRGLGVVAGDRVVGYMPNMPQTIIAMLAATSIGAIWSSCSPDFGTKGVLDRFGQIEPKVLFVANGYSYNGKKFSSLTRVAEILGGLSSTPQIIVVPYTEERADLGDLPSSAMHYADFISKDTGLEIEFEQLPFDHPLYIMYSSGTTGLPKCMVQSAGGILIHHIKELKLHTDLRREDNIFYFTTCGWMMWNWLVSSLAVGATVVLFDGSPFYPGPEALWKLAEDEKVSIFGTSAKYIDAIEKQGLKPRTEFDLTDLRAVLSTGSPLSDESFEYTYRDIKEDLCLSSISGGTDLNGCFAAGNPMGPVYTGELQCRCLAMNVHAFDASGNSIVGQKGELVCTAPFPSMPIYFWNDEEGQKYHKAYFDVYPGIWRHGDFVEVSETGGVTMFGRSDATLNPGGVRIGTAEIYRVVENMEEFADSVVIGQDWKDDVRVILFVKLKEGVELTGDLMKKVRDTIRASCSPRHMPAKVIPVDDIPYTINMKKVELAVKNIVHGLPVLNRDALANPEALDLYRDLPELKE